ncbi:hypothetical protein I302_107414 [Kwoniella bestiolae CBS 10118]|uniref:F-box domain-containing protein n=1 Tax=Kwoniella bestiolae CBS 10118 TaxID=1296100 RepID=A0A1B9FYN0_9TREE|nr:hypothetical protein I302_06846 [Kwoniella bestiolae CBS 10118]OCF23861.1 hypothetical protein I302_06846 [Kwoniella bestiolae CBS 10118]
MAIINISDSTAPREAEQKKIGIGGARAGLKDLPNEIVIKIIKHIHKPQDHVSFSQVCYSTYKTYNHQDIFKTICINLGYSLPICYAQPNSRRRQHGVNRRSWVGLLNRLIKHARRCQDRECVPYGARVLPNEWKLLITKRPILQYESYTGSRTLHNHISSLGNVTFKQFCNFEFQLHPTPSTYPNTPNFDGSTGTLLHPQMQASAQGINSLIHPFDGFNDNYGTQFDYSGMIHEDFRSLWNHPNIENAMATYPPTMTLWLSISFQVNGERYSQFTYLESKNPLTVQDVLLSLCCLLKRQPSPSLKERLAALLLESNSSSKLNRTVNDAQRYINNMVKRNRASMEIDFDQVFADRPPRDHYIAVNLSNQGPNNAPLLRFTSVFA